MFKLMSIVIAGLFLLPAHADDYMDMLEAESADLILDQSGQLGNKEEKTSSVNTTIFSKPVERNWSSLGLDDQLPSELKPNEFEDYLKSEYMGTFMFYRKLNSMDRATVYNQYMIGQLKDIEGVRQTVISFIK